jgi:hypothetical protein
MSRTARGLRPKRAGHPSCHVRGTGIDDVPDRLRAHGAELVGELEQDENSHRLCYVRGPEGIIVELAEQIE